VGGEIRRRPPEDPAPIRAIRARTPARLLIGRAGPSYRTAVQLELRWDHAAAVDAVRREFDPARDFDAAFAARYRLFEVRTRAGSKEEFLMRPDLGRAFDESGRREVASRCARGADLQPVIGDGLSATAVAAQVPRLLPLIEARARERGLSFGQPFLVRYCRVGILNEIGELLDPSVAVLLIGERPGLATAESLSAYLAFRPRAGHTDAQRNLVSNIHARGVGPEEAAERILALAASMRRLQTSGTAVKEELPQRALE
jgi:ethanolamine ammonia-lyase small subunit